MTELNYDGRILHSIEDESVLDCLLRNKVDYPHACRSGVCQACLIKTTDKPINAIWQDGLPDTLKAQGYFLACQAKPTNTLHLKKPDTAECEQEAIINGLTQLNHNVIRIELLTENLKNWIPGQYLNLMNPAGVSRSYSIANIPQQEGYIELHIKLKEDGLMSQWLQNTATVNTRVHIRGPFGKCYYIKSHKPSFDMLLVGTGTGLAPLLAIAKSALNEKHQGKITLIHGGSQDSDIYFDEALQTLASVYDNFDYIPCVLKTNGRYPEASIFNKTLSHLSPNIKAMQVYVCGPSDTTTQLKTKVFLAGVPSQNIFSDAFI